MDICIGGYRHYLSLSRYSIKLLHGHTCRAELEWNKKTSANTNCDTLLSIYLYSAYKKDTLDAIVTEEKIMTLDIN